MATPINSTQQGFVFLNKVGQYAQTRMLTGFTQKGETVCWVDNINDADIFPHEAMAPA